MGVLNLPTSFVVVVVMVVMADVHSSLRPRHPFNWTTDENGCWINIEACGRNVWRCPQRTGSRVFRRIPKNKQVSPFITSKSIIYHLFYFAFVIWFCSLSFFNRPDHIGRTVVSDVKPNSGGIIFFLTLVKSFISHRRSLISLSQLPNI